MELGVPLPRFAPFLRFSPLPSSDPRFSILAARSSSLRPSTDTTIPLFLSLSLSLSLSRSLFSPIFFPRVLAKLPLSPLLQTKNIRGKLVVVALLLLLFDKTHRQRMADDRMLLTDNETRRQREVAAEGARNCGICAAASIRFIGRIDIFEAFHASGDPRSCGADGARGRRGWREGG